MKARISACLLVIVVLIALLMFWRLWIPGSESSELQQYAAYSAVIEADHSAGTSASKSTRILAIRSEQIDLHRKPVLLFFLRGPRTFRSDTGAAYLLMIASFLVNQRPAALARMFRLSVPYELASPSDFSALISSTSSGGPGLAAYAFSPIAFNRGITKALIYVERRCGQLCGEYEYFLAEKKNGRWAIKWRFVAGES